jgi:hypothetical protein
MNGLIYLTRNNDEIGNNSPGFWNHAAIGYENTIVEAQEIPKKIIQVRLEPFQKRYPEYLVLQCKDQDVQERAGKYSYQLVGRPYNRWASRFFLILPSYNCVSLIRECFEYATGRKFNWVIPDQIQLADIFSVLYHYKSYDDWIKPDDWFEGRIK